MKPDSWLPFYGGDFFSAVEGHDDAMAVGYLRALWHYWHHLHCAGLPDDDEYLRKICRCENIHWARTRDIIFDDLNFFVKIDGKWHQKRAHEEFNKSAELYAKKVNQTAGALKARGITPNVTSHVTSQVTFTKPQPQSQPQLQAQQQPVVERETPLAEIPPMGRKEFDELAKMRAVPPECAEWFWNTNDGRNWTDSHGQPIRKVEPLLINAAIAWRSKRPKHKSHAP